MTVRLETGLGSIRIVDQKGELSPTIKTTLRLQGFLRRDDVLAAEHAEQEDLVALVLDLLQNAGVRVELDEVSTEIVERRKDAHDQLEESREQGQAIKGGELDELRTREFVHFLASGLKRRLLPHQVKAAIHLITLAHGTNFSVPGSRKTSVVLAAYEYLRANGVVTSLFVVGPRSCFMPWQKEFELTLGREARVEILAGGDVRERRQRYYPYYPKAGDEPELYLTTYQTLSRDKEQVQHLLQSRTNRAFFVIDEAHYMKQGEGVWANAVAETSRNARKRCVLTGTPFPKSYADGINQFDVLYPNSGIFSPSVRRKIRHASQSGEHDDARALLEPKIDSLYYRVRKSELQLCEPVFVPPIQVNMNPIERELYDCIDKRIGELEQKASNWDLDTIVRLRKGRQIRRRQATSYAALLLLAIDGYSEQLINPKDELLNEKIRNYDKLETPGKVQRLLQEVWKLYKHEEKVVVWASFVGTLHKIKEECDKESLESRVVYGGTPTEDGMDEDSRETIIECLRIGVRGWIF